MYHCPIPMPNESTMENMAYYNSTTEKQYDTKQPHIFGFREIFHMPQQRVEISLIKINNVNIVRLEWSYR